MPPLLVLDAIVFVSALIACVLWFRASHRKVRRVSRLETLDHADFNRLITNVNRTQILNAQAALATGIATALAAARFALDAIK